MKHKSRIFATDGLVQRWTVDRVRSFHVKLKLLIFSLGLDGGQERRGWGGASRSSWHDGDFCRLFSVMLSCLKNNTVLISFDFDNEKSNTDFTEITISVFKG